MSDTNRYLACAISIAVLLLATSCHEGAHNESTPVVTTSAAEDIAIADQLYSHREETRSIAVSDSKEDGRY